MVPSLHLADKKQALLADAIGSEEEERLGMEDLGQNGIADVLDDVIL